MPSLPCVGLAGLSLVVVIVILLAVAPGLLATSTPPKRSGGAASSPGGSLTKMADDRVLPAQALVLDTATAGEEITPTSASTSPPPSSNPSEANQTLTPEVLTSPASGPGPAFITASSSNNEQPTTTAVVTSTGGASAGGNLLASPGTGTNSGSAALLPLPPVLAIPVKMSLAAATIVASPVKPVGIEKVKLADGRTVSQWQALDFTIGYQAGPDSGQVCKWGLTVLNGHNWYRRSPGVFVNLHKVVVGDTIEITDSQGRQCQYRVETSQQFGPLDTSWLYNPGHTHDLTTSHLILYTCSLDFRERRVVTATMISPPPLPSS